MFTKTQWLKQFKVQCFISRLYQTKFTTTLLKGDTIYKHWTWGVGTQGPEDHEDPEFSRAVLNYDRIQL